MLFFSEANYRGNHAGTKARNDVESILRAYGAKPVNSRRLELKESKNHGIQSNIANRLGFLRFYFDLCFVRNQTVIIQYPMLAFDIQFEYIKRLSKYNKVIFVVHDIQSLRRENTTGLEQEIQLLNLAHGLIVHNCFMEKKCREIGVKVERYYLLNCFDYLFDGVITHEISDADVAFAGNLEKSEFLHQMCDENPQIQFNLYGSGWTTDHVSTNARYNGSFLPDEIPGKLQGKYGLIWDGKTTLGCTGAVGEYTRINNPHKLSLYIAAGIPVIVWDQAAIAAFVREKNIGIAVSRIDTFQGTLEDISDAQYQIMKKNVLEVRKRVVSGEYLKAVLSEIERSPDK